MSKLPHPQHTPDSTALVSPPPCRPPHYGIHAFLYSYACECAEISIPPEVCLTELLRQCGSPSVRRFVPEHEMESAVESAYTKVLSLDRWADSEEQTPRFPRFDRTAAEREFIQRGTTLDDLRAASPIAPPERVKPILSELFAPDELVCMSCGPNIAKSSVRTLAERLQRPEIVLERNSFLVSHPMTARTGITKDGREDRPRAASNTGPRRWVVCDFDVPPPEWHPSIIGALSEYGSPNLILNTGGKGLHAWFPIGNTPPEAVQTFEELAAELGADPALLGDAKRCQWMRTPNAVRDNGRRQDVLFWNPTGKELAL